MDNENIKDVENIEENVENNPEVENTDETANISDAEKIQWLQEEIARLKSENESHTKTIANLKDEYKKAFLSSPVKSSDAETDSDEFDEEMFRGSKESKLPDKNKTNDIKPIWK